MDSKLTIRFLNKINTFDDREYLISIIKFHAAPTLEGIKPSSLICFTKGRRDLYSIWNIYKNEVSSLIDIDNFEVHGDSISKLVLFYNPYILGRIISSSDNMKYLQRIGYGDITNIMDALDILRSRFIQSFPHEIGIFLGIPYEDVKGFIKNSGANFITNGYLKVYSDPKRAAKTFQEYDYSRICVMKSMMEEFI
jgi:hypothetical protein